MARISYQEIIEEISKYLTSDETLISVGIFKRVPPASMLLLTRGMAWFLSKEFYVGVTEQRLFVLPLLNKTGKKLIFEEMISAGFDEVDIYQGFINETILDLRKSYKGKPLKLRFKTLLIDQAMDPFDFIAAIKQGKASLQ
jgi:hypothetical protein